MFCFVFVFFFKQKTAYEMRISDWSSDVCSSDLGGMICPRVPEAQIVPHAILGSYPALSIEGSDSSPMVTTVAPTMPVDAASSMPTKIGRASCRERVCQYV